MFDYTNLILNNTDTARGLLNNPLLNFYTKIVSKTGRQLDGIHQAEYANMVFTVHAGGRIQLSGSLHKMYNRLVEGHDMNHDTFSYNKVIRSIGLLREKFGIDPEDTGIHGIEYAFNLQPTDFESMFKSFVTYRKWRWNRMTAETPIKGIECSNSLYRIKVYDKGLNFGLPVSILRFEFKAVKMRALEPSFPLGLKLIDLANPQIWEKCNESLLNTLNDCIFSDKINTSRLSSADRKVFINGMNPLMWEALNKRNRYHFKKRYNSIIEQHGKISTKAQLSLLMEQEYIKILVPTKNNIGLFHQAIERDTS